MEAAGPNEQSDLSVEATQATLAAYAGNATLDLLWRGVGHYDSRYIFPCALCASKVDWRRRPAFYFFPWAPCVIIRKK